MGAAEDVRRINSRLAKFKETLAESIALNLAREGEEAVTHAKDNRGYTDRTGNLCNSTGYTVVERGDIYSQAVVADSDPVSGTEQEGADKAKAKENALKAFNEMRDDGEDCVQLCVVAGMDYAKHVEDHGRNVLELTRLKVKAEARQTIEDAVDDALKHVFKNGGK